MVDGSGDLVGLLAVKGFAREGVPPVAQQRPVGERRVTRAPGNADDRPHLFERIDLLPDADPRDGAGACRPQRTKGLGLWHPPTMPWEVVVDRRRERLEHTRGSRAGEREVVGRRS
jgi:hypothetical protein